MSFLGMFLATLLIIGVILGLGLALLLGIKFIAAFLVRVFACVGGIVFDPPGFRGFAVRNPVFNSACRLFPRDRSLGKSQSVLQVVR